MPETPSAPHTPEPLSRHADLLIDRLGLLGVGADTMQAIRRQVGAVLAEAQALTIPPKNIPFLWVTGEDPRSLLSKAFPQIHTPHLGGIQTNSPPAPYPLFNVGGWAEPAPVAAAGADLGAAIPLNFTEIATLAALGEQPAGWKKWVALGSFLEGMPGYHPGLVWKEGGLWIDTNPGDRPVAHALFPFCAQRGLKRNTFP